MQVAVPDIGDFSDVPVIEVLVAPGDSVAPEDPLLTLESDKATMDVPAPAGGVVGELLVSVGDTVSEGTPILTLTPDADEGATAEPAAPGAVETAVEAEDGARPDETAAPGAVESAVEAQPDEVATPAVASDGAGSAGPVYASPSVRRLARERGIDLATVAGTGRKGRITKDDLDLDRPAAAPVAAPAAAPAFDGLPPWPQVDFAAFGPIERVPLSRIQRLSGPNLARNWVMIPHVTHNDEADITELEAFRKRTNAEQSAVKVTMVALLIKASVAALQAYPALNSSLDGDALVQKNYWNIGFAADTPQGLVVPVIKNADRKGILEIAGELTELSSRAREGKLGMNDMRGGTFTISSLGGIGGTSFTPIVNAPEVAILGVTRSAMKPVWDGSEFRPRLMLPLSLSYDHRVIDGALAARFVAHLVTVLSDLRRVLL
jgi:pyruvate dehydrogenase E2 component (dihydrolipoamide acetyltransferase)